MSDVSKLFKKILNSKPNIRIKLLGDSITHGMGGTGFEWDGEVFACGFQRNTKGYCWAALFQEHMRNNYNCSVVNNGCSGTDIEFILENFNSLVDDYDDIVICAIGTNNRDQLKSNALQISKKEFAKGFYDKIIGLYNRFNESGIPVIFVANIPASNNNEIDGEDYWRILNMCDINRIYKEASENTHFGLISLYDLFDSYCQENNILIDDLLIDGLHPNDDGYMLIFKFICRELGI